MEGSGGEGAGAGAVIGRSRRTGGVGGWDGGRCILLGGREDCAMRHGKGRACNDTGKDVLVTATARPSDGGPT